MFIKDGKSIFGNIGLVISICILIIVLALNYNKCMNTDTDTHTDTHTSIVELFTDANKTNTTPTNRSTPEPQSVRVNINGSSISLNFTIDMSNNNPIPKKFMVVLVQYDKNYKNTGNNKLFVSNEYELNNAVSVNQTTYQTNLCSLVNGVPTCQYSFDNLDIIDAAGNPYWYKLGISAVYDWGNSAFITPYNVVSSNRLFTLNSSIDNQNNLFTDFIKYKQMQSQESSSSSYANANATADGQYEFIKSQLGGYPSNLIMEPTSATQNLLSDLVDKSMSQSILNVNIGTSK
jgi:hypothetical protein